ncbi:pirin family protein [Burkholderia cenocepacia]|uniref:pirin family protein n=1 Tax=Burkholderia cenocepacia TaxID=95486 RepID=UPI00196A9928|nr:pirin family protein [Burkholderia cenocepacia]MBN3534166.1 pirin family protein [Burkholderia cenocepacia]MBR8029965.1 pirin family protein [Burkholderia cenocepacia]MBR8173790.1 pirin family protein [Burkholderia cenocepacia]MBR8428558.1 pirin family protein [Burkholderia cenocepacia]MBU9659631.1 pirin family protein [Burkholderia cenocepacia]
MTIVATLQHVNHGSHFRADGLRGVAELIDPFLGVDHAWMSAPTFPPHRHAGMSAVSYVLPDSETGIINRDSIGTRNLIRPGGLHWTTAGGGVVHEEVPAVPGKTVHSLQIFVGLALEMRGIAPFPLVLEPSEIPIVQLPGAKVDVLAGNFGRVRSPLNPPTDVTILSISIDKGAVVEVPVASGECAFVMPILGAMEVNGEAFARDGRRLPVFPAQTALRTVVLRSLQSNVQVVWFAGRPLGYRR